MVCFVDILVVCIIFWFYIIGFDDVNCIIYNRYD